MIKHTSWPRVDKNDHGIRPAGKPDGCFYCNRKVGNYHTSECVIVESLYGFDVYIGDRKVGTYQKYLPYFWDVDAIDWKMNKGTWCSDNALDEIKWENGEVPAEIKDLDFEEGCSCPILRFEFTGVIDAGPFTEEPHTEEEAAIQNQIRRAFERGIEPPTTGAGS